MITAWCFVRAYIKNDNIAIAPFLPRSDSLLVGSKQLGSTDEDRIHTVYNMLLRWKRQMLRYYACTAEDLIWSLALFSYLNVLSLICWLIQ